MTDLEAKLEEFFESNPEIDEKAKEDLKACSPEMQEMVLARGDISDARNKSAALIARIRDARYKAGSGAASVTEEEIENFLEENEIDAGAAEELRTSPGYVQAMVLERGKLTGCRNKEGALIARIRDAKRNGGGGGGGGGKDGGGMKGSTKGVWGWPGWDEWYEMMQYNQYMMKGKGGGGGKGGGKWGPY
eukprot:TRINITY_DN18245_c0_g1_i1.p1 TRINITY_DN18245_c0_g1~~TRINITY_DN18245_c0_g1_i1.p1  ORF type:complete len:190 (-),score=52.25 TRINITY_DN18245_c0_g1_i1:202-771(-)